jgi:hypothetical protein
LYDLQAFVFFVNQFELDYLPFWAFYVRHEKGISMKNIVLKLDNEDYHPAFVFDDV